MQVLLVQLFMVAAYIALTIIVMVASRWFFHLFEWWVIAIGVISFVGYAIGWLTRDKSARRELARAHRVTIFEPRQDERDSRLAGRSEGFGRGAGDIRQARD